MMIKAAKVKFIKKNKNGKYWLYPKPYFFEIKDKEIEEKGAGFVLFVRDINQKMVPVFIDDIVEIEKSKVEKTVDLPKSWKNLEQFKKFKK